MIATDSFQMPADGWYQISALGEFPHAPTGLVQVVDDAGCKAMVDFFRQAAMQPNFAGVLIDFDHFSLDQSKPSEAAGWITQLEQRPTGLWAQIRWSDSGQQAVSGGRYRFISPVWKQDECEMLGNNRVRPLKLVNAAVTNDPNIRGMMPLSNRAVTAQPPRVNSLRLANRAAFHFARGLVLANGGMYSDPRTGVLANKTLNDKQRRYLHWLYSQGGGSSSSRGDHGESGPQGDSGAAGAGNNNAQPLAEVIEQTDGSMPPPADANTPKESATPATDPILALDTSNYDSAQNEISHVSPSGDTPAPSSDGVNFSPVRDTAARIKAIEAQRDALIAQRPIEPTKPDFKQIDLRKLERDLMKQGKGTNEIRKALDDAKAENDRRKHALDDIKKQLHKAYPNDGAKQAQALSKYMDQLTAQWQKQHDAWSKVNAAIDKAVAAANKMIADEQARGDEQEKLAQQKTQNAAAVVAQKATARQENFIQKQISADLADARKQAAADAKAKRAASKPTPSADTTTAMSREMRRRKFYWQSLARGEVDAAKMLYPNADTDGNFKTVQDLARGVKSKNDEKAHEKALAKLAQEAP